MIKINGIGRNVKLKAIERTGSGVRFLEIEGKILKIEDPYIYIKGYVIDMNNIIEYKSY
ncbi:hypothetical protein [uncultured Tyzzerella sp.]|uniref:hypothetical protein n=1 Tax=uncultured Tyzzerella sp. TaxID=2321398 RepID=UPI002942A0D4|nr:hypothetical protein [uncultured Tyzzerella sp.]